MNLFFFFLQFNPTSFSFLSLILVSFSFTLLFYSCFFLFISLCFVLFCFLIFFSFFRHLYQERFKRCGLCWVVLWLHASLFFNNESISALMSNRTHRHGDWHLLSNTSPYNLTWEESNVIASIFCFQMFMTSFLESHEFIVLPIFHFVIFFNISSIFILICNINSYK